MAVTCLVRGKADHHLKYPLRVAVSVDQFPWLLSLYYCQRELVCLLLFLSVLIENLPRLIQMNQTSVLL